MSDKDIYKECAATSTATLEEYITNPCIPKNENEWWASREIERLRAENAELRQALTAILNDVGYHNPMRMTTEISDKVLFEAKAALNEKIL